jgi:hypothetical protein
MGSRQVEWGLADDEQAEVAPVGGQGGHELAEQSLMYGRKTVSGGWEDEGRAGGAQRLDERTDEAVARAQRVKNGGFAAVGQRTGAGREADRG